MALTVRIRRGNGKSERHDLKGWGEVSKQASPGSGRRRKRLGRWEPTREAHHNESDALGLWVDEREAAPYRVRRWCQVARTEEPCLDQLPGPMAVLGNCQQGRKD